MEQFWKVAGGALLVTVLGLAVGKKEKDLAAVLSMAACAMAAAVALGYIKSILDFVWELQELSQMGAGILGCLLKALGVGIVSQVAASLCADGGNAALGKTVQLLGCVVILYLSLPIFREMLKVIQEILR